MDKKTGISFLHCPNCGREEVEYESDNGADYYVCYDCGLEFRLHVITKPKK
jgi:predicted RNA-binding Zn-ribbon protein involved in translation (DUF1610 family)